MFTKSGINHNHRNFYTNIINWKTENCQIGVNAQSPGGGGDVNVQFCCLTQTATPSEQLSKLLLTDQTRLQYNTARICDCNTIKTHDRPYRD